MKYLLKTTCNDSHLKLSDIIANEHPDGESSDSDMDYDNGMDVKDIFTTTRSGRITTNWRGLHIFCETYNLELLSSTDNTGMLF